MARRVRAILFDKDGTLFDFDATWGAVTETVLARLAPSPETARAMAAAGGYDLDTRRFRPGSPIVAGATLETAEAWAGLLPGLSVDEIAARMDAVVIESVGPDTLVPAAADLPGLLARLRADGRPLGVATHDSAANARLHLAAVGAEGAFDFLAGYDSGHGLKPGPGMLTAFAGAVGVAPHDVAMIGDSVHDLGMARAAGALSVGVLTGPASAADLAELADHILPSIEALPDLLTRLAAEA